MKASRTTRSCPEVWLIGKSTNHLPSSRLPSNGDVLRSLMYYHVEEHATIRSSISCAVKDILKIWMIARIPTQRIDSCVRKLNKLYDSYHVLKDNRTLAGENYS